MSHGAVKRRLPPLSVFTREQQMVVRIKRAQRRAGKKRSERAQGVANKGERSGAELSRRAWKALVWLKARVEEESEARS